VRVREKLSTGGAITAFGLDVGSATTKLVGVDGEGRIVLRLLEESDPRVEAQTARLVATARARTQAPAGAPLVATGYGRKLAAGGGRAVTEITCHARGVFAALGRAGTLVDIGGQDSKVVVVDGAGKVADFAMNDKCAAGTGRFLENTASRLKLSLDDMARVALEAEAEVPISSTCTVFAESELVSLIARGAAVPAIVRGLHRSLVRRVAALARSAGLTPPAFLSGGVARSEAVRRMLAEELGCEVEVPPDPQLMGAYGAALIAAGR
jgi:predicted CoA-substrate-specific enzyme activase